MVIILVSFINTKGFAEIKNGSAFATIRDINEVLSLSNEPQQLLNMTLDTLSQALKTECCWVQTINPRKRSLHLAADRGFTSEMRREMSAMDMNHRFSKQVVGLGNEIIIPDLSNDGRYTLASFRSAGYKWLLAAPLMTYRVHGVLGIASRTKKRFRKEIAELVMVIAGLIGTALNKASLSQKLPPPQNPESLPDKENPAESITPREEIPTLTDKSAEPDAPTVKNVAKPAEGSFHKHVRKMKSFRSLHH